MSFFKKISQSLRSSSSSSQKAFTLIELLIVIGILAILATIVLLVINPIQLIKQTRDANRLTELNQIDKALALFESFGGIDTGVSNKVYVSIPSAQTDCSDLGLPPLGGGYTYACSNSTDYRKTNGSGWIPVDFTSVQSSAGSLFAFLPIDPINTVANGYYYTYIKGSWALSASMESERYIASNTKNDGGPSSTRYEMGNKLDLNVNLSWVCGDTLVDSRDSEEYTTVKIGTQCWMAQHINVGTMIVGASTQGTSCASIQKYCYSDSEANCTSGGAFYLWDQAMCGSTTEGARGICPTSWHIPTDTEQYTLENYLKDDGQTCNSARNAVYDCNTAGTKLKSSGSSGFNSITVGYYQSGSFYNNIYYTGLWSSTQADSTFKWMRSLFTNNVGVSRAYISKVYGFSIRCLKD